MTTPRHPVSALDHPVSGARSRRLFLPTTARLLAGFAIGVLCLPWARAADAAAAPDSGTVVVLPTFNVNTEKDDNFTGSESLSLTRTGVKLLDIPQSISIINRSYMDMVSPTGFNVMIQYVAGASMGNLPFYELQDRFMLRGFSTNADFVDGFLTINGQAGQTNYIDHVEVVKGPSAIMSTNASGVVGGAVNKVSVSPTTTQVNTISASYGPFDSGVVSLDVGGALTPDKKLLYRLLYLNEQHDGYFDYQYIRRSSLLPMLKYDFSPNTEVWIKAEFDTNHYGSYNGLMLDGRTNAPIDVPIKTNVGEDNPENWRLAKMWRVWAQFSTRLNDHLVMRLAALDSRVTVTGTESILAPSGATTPTRQPDGSFAYTPYVQYSIPPTYVNGTAVPRVTQAILTDTPRREIQNDYAFNFDTGPVSNRLLIGANLVDFPQTTQSWSSSGSSTASSSPINPFLGDDASHPGTVFVNYNQPPISTQVTPQSYAKVFAQETAGFFKDRLLLSYGASRHHFVLSSQTIPYNQLTGVYGTPTVVPQSSLYKNIVQYGAVFKVLPNVSLFYGRNSNFTANPIQNGAFLPPAQGQQKETGIKAEIIPDRVSVSVSYFDISQINSTVPTFPQTIPATQTLIPGETSRGFDGDFSIRATKNLTFVGSFSIFKARVQSAAPFNLTPQPYDGQIYQTLPVNNASENNFAVWAQYKFTTARLQGLSVGLGSVTASKRAITDSANQIFYGYLPGYSLLNLSLSYDTKHVRYQLNVDNLLNRDYWLAARSNQILFAGTPINPRVTVTYKF